MFTKKSILTLFFFIKQRHYFFWCFFIFLLTFSLLGLIYSSWGFIHDDFGIIWHSRIHNWNDLITLFFENSTLYVVQPSNFRTPPPDFFYVYYRPLSYVFNALQMHFFNFSPYGYFLVKVFFHACNAALLFYVFSFVTKKIYLLLFCSLAFAFHPTLTGYEGVGWIAAQIHTINLTFMIVCVLFLKKHLDTEKLRYLIGSVFFFIVSLFCIETALPFPLILMIGTYFYHHKKNRCVKIGAIFGLISFCYIGMRAVIYHTRTISIAYSFLERMNPITFLRNRFFDIVNLLCDLSSIPGIGCYKKPFKMCILFCFLILSLFLVIYSSKKKYLFAIICCFIIMLWPAIIRYYTSRYLYPALPFFCLFFIVAITSMQIKLSYRREKQIMCMALIFIFFMGTSLIFSLYKLEEEIKIPQIALKELASHKEILDKNLCFIGLPMKWFRTGITQAIWMHGINTHLPIFNDQATTVIYDKPNLTMSIKLIRNGFNLAIFDSADASFWGLKDSNLYMGDIIIHQKDIIGNRLLNISYIIEQKWFKKELFFITWNYKTNLFKVIGQLKK
jgi:hypothetical protein